MKTLIRLAVALVLAGAVAVSFPGRPAASPTQWQDFAGKIAYATDEDGDYEIYWMSVNGSRIKQMTDNGVDDYSPSWSPDGRHMVFVHERRSGNRDLYILNVRKRIMEPWVVSRRGDEAAPEWSPDGKWIAFSVGDGDGSSVVAMTLDKRRTVTISSTKENSSNDFPSWSDNSKEVAFVESYDEGDIFIASRCCADSERRQVTTDDSIESDLDWSPDGACIVYSRYANQLTGYDMYSVAADGSRPPRPLATTAADTVAGAWAPDSSRIVYVSNEQGTYDLYTMASDGTDVQPQMSGTAANEITPDWWDEPDTVEPTEPDCMTQPSGPLPTIPPVP